jgi:hypothetical protein
VVLPSAEQFYGEFTTEILEFAIEEAGKEACREVAVLESVAQLEIGSSVFNG